MFGFDFTQTILARPAVWIRCTLSILRSAETCLDFSLSQKSSKASAWSETNNLTSFNLEGRVKPGPKMESTIDEALMHLKQGSAAFSTKHGESYAVKVAAGQGPVREGSGYFPQEAAETASARLRGVPQRKRARERE